MSPEGLAHNFAYHPPRSTETVRAHEDVRSLCGYVAAKLNELLPDGREKSLAMTKIEEAMFWANAAIARSRDTEAS